MTLALLGPDHLFGLCSTFGEDNPTSGATTLESSYICFATRTRPPEDFPRYPRMMPRMTAPLAEQIFYAETRVARLHTHDPRPAWRTRCWNFARTFVIRWMVAAESGTA